MNPPTKAHTIRDGLIKMIELASTTLPDYVLNLLNYAERNEKNIRAKLILRTLIKNAQIAREERRPICQDTGIPVFFVRARDTSIWYDIEDAVDRATEIGLLRPNASDIMRGRISGNKAEIIFLKPLGKRIWIGLLLRGGGASYVSRLYSIPPIRGLDGVIEVIKNAIKEGGSKPCPPVFVGVGIGGTESRALINAQLALLKMPQKNFLREHLPELNLLKIGPMGFGGRTTVLDINVAMSYRHPATFLIGVSINCWALRRSYLIISEKGVYVWN